MVISVVSGNGGTGKTFVAANLAISVEESVQLLDCDVEEPNVHIFLKPRISETNTVSLPIPKVDEAKCTHCGVCAKICEFNALAVLNDMVTTFDRLCHYCGDCMFLCPEIAIHEVSR